MIGTTAAASPDVPSRARSKSLSLSSRRGASMSSRRSPLPPPPRPRPTFHLAVDSDNDEPLSNATTERESSRRFHALSELLSTELGYLLDLRALVSVYLRLLPVLQSRSSLPLPHGPLSNPPVAYFSRPPIHGIAQPAPPRTQSHPHLNGNTYDETATPPHPIPTRVEKSTSRHLFSTSDLNTITRNAERILDFHERLVHRLRQVLLPFGIPMDTAASAPLHHNPPTDVHRIINAVSAVFVDHSASFHQYQTFCSGHSEAFDLVRKVQHRYPTEWDAFELRCAAVAAEIRLHDIPGEPLLSSESRRQALDLCHRRHSLSSLDALFPENLNAPICSASESGHVNKDSSRRPQLMFMDYMIKPVQRVCRYPLLFDQLQERDAAHGLNDGLADSSPVSDGQDAVKIALWAMQTVARLVDEARRQQDLFAKSIQIVSRITQGLLTSAVTHSRPLQAASLPTFLSALGPCYLSGSLDVIHYRGTKMARLGTVRAKYLGAFLFPGGFLVLVKVAKSKVYEPKHWFNMREFELVDSNLDDVLLPSWFRLSSKAHLFEFAASCRREKDIWVDAIRGAIVEDVPWNDDPPSSLRADLAAPVPEDAQFEVTPLPTIQSIPELDGVLADSGETVLLPPVTRNPSHIYLHTQNRDDTVLSMAGPCRRSLVAGPAPESNSFHLVRSTASAREQVDRCLLDVFSENCLTARFHAHTHEEDLFEAQKITRSFSRSTSALTMASAMSVAAKNRLTKRESVLVPRKKSFVEGGGMPGDAENHTNSTLSVAPKRRQHPSKLKIVAMAKATTNQGDEDGNEPPLESSSPMSHCSSVSFVTPVTPLTIPAPLPSGKSDSFHAESVHVCQKNCPPKRSKSMIENVRGFFAPRPASPTTALTRESSTRSSVSNSSLLRWWSRESLRQRVRSAPDVPSEELPSTFTTVSLHTAANPRSLLVTTDRPYSQPDLHCLYSETADLSTTEFGVDHPSQRRSIFSSRGPRRRHTASVLLSERRKEDPAPVPARIRRNFSFLQRFAHNTSSIETIPLPHHHP